MRMTQTANTSAIHGSVPAGPRATSPRPVGVAHHGEVAVEVGTEHPGAATVQPAEQGRARVAVGVVRRRR